MEEPKEIADYNELVRAEIDAQLKAPTERPDLRYVTGDKVAAIVGLTLIAGTAIFLGQVAYYKLLARKQAKERIEHETVWLENRGHEIDVYVLAVCEKLWAEDIETFFSCQGGPTILKRKRIRAEPGTSQKDAWLKRSDVIHIYRAYVSVLTVDAEKVCDILQDLHPVIDPCHGSDHPDRVAVRFDPSPEALGPSWSLDDVRE